MEGRMLDTGEALWTGIHPRAIVHDDAQLGPDVSVGPGAIVGPGVVIGFSGVGAEEYCVADGERQNCLLARNGNLLQLGALLDSPQPRVRRGAVFALVDYREETGFADVNDFLNHQVLASRKAKMGKTRGLLGKSSAFFLLSAEVELAQRNMRLYSVLERRDRSVVALVRAGGSL